MTFWDYADKHWFLAMVYWWIACASFAAAFGGRKVNIEVKNDHGNSGWIYPPTGVNARERR